MANAKLIQYNKEDLKNNNNIINLAQYSKIGISYDEKDDWFTREYQNIDNYEQYKDFSFWLDGNEIRVGKTDIYETPELIEGSELKFLNGYPPSIQINVYEYNKG